MSCRIARVNPVTEPFRTSKLQARGARVRTASSPSDYFWLVISTSPVDEERTARTCGGVEVLPAVGDTARTCGGALMRSGVTARGLEGELGGKITDGGGLAEATRTGEDDQRLVPPLVSC